MPVIQSNKPMSYDETKAWMILKFGNLDKALTAFYFSPDDSWGYLELKILDDHFHNETYHRDINE